MKTFKQNPVVTEIHSFLLSIVFLTLEEFQERKVRRQPRPDLSGEQEEICSLEIYKINKTSH